MSEGVFALLGVGVGALANYFVATARDQKTDKREARAACRLIGRELTGALYGIREWLAVGDVREPERSDVLRFPAWNRYHAMAARHLAPEEWDAVSDAYLLLYTVRTHRAFCGELELRTRRHLERTAAAIEEALRPLRVRGAAAMERPRDLLDAE